MNVIGGRVVRVASDNERPFACHAGLAKRHWGAQTVETSLFIVHMKGGWGYLDCLWSHLCSRAAGGDYLVGYINVRRDVRIAPA